MARVFQDAVAKTAETLQIMLGKGSGFLANLGPAAVFATTVLDLSTVSWTVSNDALNISVPAKVPSHIHLDLFREHVIGDPYYGLNDFNLRWVGWNNWTYTSAPISGLSRDAEHTWLLFEGLDTFTSIFLCEQHVASTNNQFRQYYFDVSNILDNCKTDPVLSINFGSAPKIANEIAAQPGQETWPYGVQQVFEFPNRWFIRKEQSDFGWDWGPAFAPAGPWLPLYVIQAQPSQIHVRNALMDVYRQGQVNNVPPDQNQPWVFNASLDYLGSLPDGASLEYTLKTYPDCQPVSTGILENVTRANGSIAGSVVLDKSIPIKLWWPVGLGEQSLYNMTVSVTSKGKTISSTTRRLGFRTIVLNELPITEAQQAQGIAPGNNWHFEINGHEFFAKGSNFIPPDAFWPRVTPERMNKLFDSVVAGNQNMLRVWSSGAYSPDFMYDLADEKGILLWSEFEFGDALYPVDSTFLDNVFHEADYQVRRVNHHPSLALWAGGNELENLELANVNESAPNEYERYKGEYETLFLTTLFPAVFENSRSISYAPSSTSNGFISLNFTQAPYMEERYETKEPGAIYGVTDYYHYDSTDAFNFSSYPVGRFSNEFGYHSMPSLQTWRQAVSETDLSFNSSTIMLRNHHYPPGGLNTTNFYNTSKGMAEMTVAVERWYPTPAKDNGIANFSSWCHATQIFQADYYASQIQFYRRGSGLPQRTLGSLYWQLEDIWQAPTWAGIEYDGRWKVLHYKAADMYKNVIISPFYNSTTKDLEVYVTSDLWERVWGVANIDWFDWSGRPLFATESADIHFEVGALNTTMVYKVNTAKRLRSWDTRDIVARMTVSCSGHLPNQIAPTMFGHESWFHAAPLSEAKLVDPDLQLVRRETEDAFTVTANKGVAAWVWLDYPAGAVVQFSENGFWLPQNGSKAVNYKVVSDTTGGAWADGVTVSSMWDQTRPI